MTAPVKDPICGKEVDPLRARAVGIFGGVTYYFCSADCKAQFKDPRKAPREPTRDIATRAAPPEEKAPPAEERAPPVAVDKPWAKHAGEREESAKVGASPSVEEELRAIGPPSSRAWLVVLVLFAVAGVVLFFALRK